MSRLAAAYTMKPYWLAMMLGALVLAGCGTTRWSDTQRTATEQLLISDAIDRAVSQLDFKAVAGKKVYLDAAPVRQSTDAAYLTSTLRQQLLASGCIVKDKLEEADYVVEVRAGAVGTDRHDLLFGVPATKIPAAVPVPGVPSSIPEIPLVTKTEQRAVAKIAVFAYNRRTGHPVWQSGVIPVESKTRDLWVFGAGPFQQGNIYKGTNFAGQKVQFPSIRPGSKGKQGKSDVVTVAQEAYFPEPETEIAENSFPASSAQSDEKRSPVGLPGNGAGEPSAETKSLSAEAKKAAAAGAPSGVIPAGHVEAVGAPGTDAPPTPLPAKGPPTETRPKIPQLDLSDLPIRGGKGSAGGTK